MADNIEETTEEKIEEKKSLMTEFKEFISRGSVVDLAVGIIVGTAFTAIVNSLVKDIIMPAIGYIIGGINFSEFKYQFPVIIDGLEPAVINYGTFIQQIINFLVIAFTVFLMVKLINKLHRKKAEEEPEEPAEPEEPEISPELQMLTEIRDLLKEKQGL